jgi:hypothetical protein
MKRVTAGVAASISAIVLNAAAADLRVTGALSAQIDAKGPAANCRLTKATSTLLHYGARLNVGNKTGLGSKFVSVVFEVVPYKGPGKYNSAEKQAGETPVEATLHTEGMPGFEEKWLATSGVLVVNEGAASTFSGTVEADLSPTKSKAGPIHLSGSWSCTLQK